MDDGINTSNNNNNNNNPEGEDREINLYAVFFKYMVYWPWFVASVLACCIGMYVFLRYQTPVYNVTSSVLIKEDEKKGANAASKRGSENRNSSLLIFILFCYRFYFFKHG